MKNFFTIFKKIAFSSFHFLIILSQMGFPNCWKERSEPSYSIFDQGNPNKKSTSPFSQGEKQINPPFRETTQNKNTNESSTEKIIDLTEFSPDTPSYEYSSEIKDWLEENGKQKLKIYLNILENFITELIDIFIGDINKALANHVKDQKIIKGKTTIIDLEVLISDIRNTIEDQAKNNKIINEEKIIIDIKEKFLKLHQQLEGKGLILIDVSEPSLKIKEISRTIFTLTKKYSEIPQEPWKALQEKKIDSYNKMKECKKRILFTHVVKIMDSMSKKDQNEIKIEIQSFIKTAYSFILHSEEEENIQFFEKYNEKYDYPFHLPSLKDLKDNDPLKQWLDRNRDESFAQWLKNELFIQWSLNELIVKENILEKIGIPNQFTLKIEKDTFNKFKEENSEFSSIIEKSIEYLLNKIGEIVANVNIQENDKINKVNEEILILKIKHENILINSEIKHDQVIKTLEYVYGPKLSNKNPLLHEVINVIFYQYKGYERRYRNLIEESIINLIKKIKFLQLKNMQKTKD